jgi:hypothetical protein
MYNNTLSKINIQVFKSIMYKNTKVFESMEAVPKTEVLEQPHFTQRLSRSRRRSYVMRHVKNEPYPIFLLDVFWYTP